MPFSRHSASASLSPRRRMGAYAPRVAWISLLAALAACVGLFASGAGVSAHGEYVSSDPAANAVLQDAPSIVHITFAEAIIPAQSAVTIYDFDGKEVSSANTLQADPNDLKTVSIQMQGDGSEGYVVVWRNVAAPDNHHDSGSFRFLVNPSPMLQQMTQSEHQDGGSSGGMSGMSSADTGVAPFVAVLIGLLGLAVGGGAGYLFSRRLAAPRV